MPKPRILNQNGQRCFLMVKQLRRLSLPTTPDELVVSEHICYNGGVVIKVGDKLKQVLQVWR